MRIKTTLLEALLLLVVTAVIGLSANALNNQGGILPGKDYFPPPRPRPDRPSAPQPPAATQPPVSDQPEMPPEKVPAQDHGLQAVSPDEAHQHFADMEGSGGLIVFVDARKPEEYADGHIPGAVNVYHYRQARDLPPVMDRLREAEVIVVYCGGGDCEDSIFLCNDLIYEHQLLYERVFLFEGGMKEWVSRGWPVRAGRDP